MYLCVYMERERERERELTHTSFFPSFHHCQVDPAKYKNIFNGFKVTMREDGVRGLAKGWAPTLIGYSMQGLCKFGFYEVFKILYANTLGEVNSCDLCTLSFNIAFICHFFFLL